MYALADCNNFFVSCERVFNPSLENKPVIVLSSNDGCVIARSNEVKALGIKMGVPLFQIKKLVKEHDIKLFSSNYILYGDMSSRVHQTLRQMVPSIEIYSIDEAFLDLHGIEENLKTMGLADYDEFARRISYICRKNTGIPVSVGVAPTKTLAKVASKLCKCYPKLKGGCYMHKATDIEKVLKKTAISDIWGIGRQTLKRLEIYGIKTAWDYAQFDSNWIKSEFGINGIRTQNELRGIPSINFAAEAPARQQICVSRTFSHEIDTYNELSEQVATFVSMSCEKLRKQNSLCFHASVFAFTNRFKENIKQQYEYRNISFPVATNSTLEINNYIQSSLRSFFTKGIKYKKAGIILSNIIPAGEIQLNLFDTIDRARHLSLMETIDKINSNKGEKLVSLANESASGIKICREHLSPEYTTKWSDIIKVHLK